MHVSLGALEKALRLVDDLEVKAKYAELEARAVPEPVVARSAPATAVCQTAAPSL